MAEVEVEVVWTGVMDRQYQQREQREAPIIPAQNGAYATAAGRFHSEARNKLLDLLSDGLWHDRLTVTSKMSLPYSHLANVIAKLCCEGVVERRYPRHRGLAAQMVPQAYRVVRTVIRAPGPSPKIPRLRAHDLVGV